MQADKFCQHHGNLHPLRGERLSTGEGLSSEKAIRRQLIMLAGMLLT
jgi:hypothetical protein